MTEDTIAKTVKITFTGAETIASFARGNMEALTKSGQIWTAGMQALTQQATAAAKTAFEEGATNFKALTAARSVKDMLALQTTIARTAFEKQAAETKTIAEAALQLSKDAFAPIAARGTEAAKLFALV